MTTRRAVDLRLSVDLRRHLVLIIACVALLQSVGAVAQSNLIINGGFDPSLSGWTAASNPAVSGSYYAPDGSLQCKYTGTTSTPFSFYDVLSQQVPVLGGGTYTLSARIKSITGKAAAFVSWRDANGKPVNNSSYPTVPFPDGEQVWVTRQTTQTAPPNAAFAVISIDIEITPGATAYFDDITLSGPPAPPSLAQPIFTATPTTLRAGQSATLSWSAPGASSAMIDNGIGGVPTQGTLTVTPSATTTYTLTAMAASGATATATVKIEVVTTSLLTITATPAGMVQTAGTAGGSDRVAIRNSGSATARVNTVTTGGFFTATPVSFDLAAGATVTVTLAGTAQPAGVYNGKIQFTDTANASATVSAPVRLLSAEPPSAPVVANATTPRVDVASAGTAAASGSISFRNDGPGTLLGLATSDQPWLLPKPDLITIPPGQTVAIPFTVDPTKVATGGPQLGTVTATVSLTYATTAGAQEGSLAGPSGSRTTSNHALVNYTGRPQTTTGPVPALSSPAFFIPTIVNQPGLVADLVAINRSSTPASNFSLLFTPANQSPIGVRTDIGSLPGNNILRYSDIVGRAFNFNTLLGTVQVRAKDLNAISVAASLVSSQNTAGNFLTGLQASRSDRAARQNERVILTGLLKDNDTVTHLFVQEVSGQATSVKTDFVDRNGSTIATRTDNLAGFAPLAAFDAAPLGAITAIVTNTGSGAIIARGLLTYITTHDNTDIVDWPLVNGSTGSEVQIIPYVARNVRAGRATRTSLALVNPSTSTLAGSLDFRGVGTGRRRAVGTSSLVGGSSLTAAPNALTVTVGPGQTVLYDDVLSALGVPAATAGALVFTPASGSARITARLDDEIDGLGRFSTELPVSPPPIRKGEQRQFAGFEDASGAKVAAREKNTFRSAFGLVETSGKAATVRVTLYSYASGDKTAALPNEERTYQLAPYEQRYFGDLTGELLGSRRDSEYDDLHSVQVIFEITNGEGTVIPYLVTSESATGDRLVRSGPF